MVIHPGHDDCDSRLSSAIALGKRKKIIPTKPIFSTPFQAAVDGTAGKVYF